MKKAVLLDKRSVKELKSFPRKAYLKFQAMFETLEVKGKLEEPFGKKMTGANDLFEIRVKQEGQWRAIYTYIKGDTIIILSAFAKKTQKTPKNELDKAKKRLLDYK